MIVVDTHIWIWSVHDDVALPTAARRWIEAEESAEIGISAISCWEVAKLVEYGRLSLPCPVADWLGLALGYPGVRLLALSPQVCVESTQLPGEFHRDAADQIIVATVRVMDAPLVTANAKILAYPHVRSSRPSSQ